MPTTRKVAFTIVIHLTGMDANLRCPFRRVREPCVSPNFRTDLFGSFLNYAPILEQNLAIEGLQLSTSERRLLTCRSSLFSKSNYYNIRQVEFNISSNFYRKAYLRINVLIPRIRADSETPNVLF